MVHIFHVDPRKTYPHNTKRCRSQQFFKRKKESFLSLFSISFGLIKYITPTKPCLFPISFVHSSKNVYECFDTGSENTITIKHRFVLRFLFNHETLSGVVDLVFLLYGSPGKTMLWVQLFLHLSIL